MASRIGRAVVAASLAIGATVAVGPGVARADDVVSHVAPPSVAPGQAALDRARAAWEKGDFDVAEPLYAEAIATGGLAPPDVLDAYVHLGCARTVLGKRAAALTAFKAAALVDPHFHVPSEAGKKATALADQARRLEAKAGTVALHAEVPDEVAARTTVLVDVTLDAAHAAVPGSRIGIYAHDTQESVVHVASVRATPAAQFELPGELMLPSTTLRVRVDWLDARANRLASTEDPIHVQAMTTFDTKAPLARVTEVASVSSPQAEAPAAQPREGEKRGGGFWHSAWPYILGGAALAAGGAAVYFATRSSDDVNVTGVRVLTH